MIHTLDSLMGRLLLLENVPVETAAQDDRGQQALGFSLLFSAVRCILQYAVLPFVLPLVGITSNAAVPVLLVINVLAMVAVFYSLRRFWKIRYVYRWQYLGVAVVALVILTAFIVMDVQKLTA